MMSQVDQFIADRQLDLSRRALASLKSADRSSLQSETHRLLGALSTYRLTAAAAVREVNSRLREAAPEVEVEAALARALEVIAAEIQEIERRG